MIKTAPGAENAEEEKREIYNSDANGIDITRFLLATPFPLEDYLFLPSSFLLRVLLFEKKLPLSIASSWFIQSIFLLAASICFFRSCKRRRNCSMFGDSPP